MTIPLPLLHRQTFLTLICLALAALADWLFYDHPIGWTLALFTAIAAATVILKSPALWRITAGRIALALTALILLALVEEPSPLAIIMSTVCFGTLVLLARRSKSSSLGDWTLRWLHLLIMIPLRILFDRAIASRWFNKHPQSRPRSTRAIHHWIIPIIAGAGFLALFAIANPIIQQWANTLLLDITTIFDWLPLYLRPSRVFLWLAIAFSSYGIFRYRPIPPRQPSVAVPPIIKTHLPFAHYFIVRCLIVFNAVFALQSILDITYLFGGASLPPGMTYTQYAHRGAYPLVATALLAGLFVLLAFKTNGPAHRSRLARNLVYLWIAQNIFLMYSTIFRTWLYVNVSLLTRLRVAVFIWVFLIALGFIYIIIKIRTRRSNAWLLNANALTLFVVLYLCAFINFSGLIADFNVRHCHEAGGRGDFLDTAYLAHLGPPALPAIEWVRPHLPHDQQFALILREKELASTLAFTLSDWRGQTLRRHRIASSIDLETLSSQRPESILNQSRKVPIP